MSKSTGSPGSRTYLESVTARFEQQHQERKKKIEEKKFQREAELVHSQYLKQNVVNSAEMAHAKFVVGTWSQKHGDVEKKWLLKDKREKQKIEARFSPYGKSPNNVRKQNLGPAQEKKRGMNFSTPSVNATELLDRNSSRSFRSVSSSAVSTATSPAVISLDDSPEVVKIHDAESSESSGPLVCPVLYCEIVFTSRGKLEQHMKEFNHCPINPTMVNEDGVLKLTQEYMCTNCEKCFKDRESWKNHVHRETPSTYCKEEEGSCPTPEQEGSCPTPSVLKVVGYLCPRTFSIFSSYKECESSIHKGTEDILKFRFQDDDSVHSVRPCPVSRALVDDFSARCLSCPYSVSCLDCEMELSNNESLQSHMSLSTGTHILTTRSSLSKEDVFAEYITENVSDFPALLSKYCNGNSLMTFSNFVKVLCHLLNENL
uniref:E3 SUMO-protein ligase ZNF451-like n=1 Tax=Crassostrea virginica TaxID=6565 RepID=A0A8B8CT94_CRAVI|nr:E3 SUMO-protein ligase ZNF451-like [Crassostrea virginica]